MTFEAHYFVNKLSAARENAEQNEMFDVAVGRYLDAVIGAYNTGIDVDSIIETDRHFVAEEGRVDMEVYDKTIELCKTSDIGLGMYGDTAKGSYARNHGIKWDNIRDSQIAVIVPREMVD